MSSSFLESQFPPGISYGAVGGPSYQTTIVQFQNGRECRNQQWATGLCVWDISHGVKTQEEVDQLVAFFRSVKGRAFGFRFKDWSDFQATTTLIGTGDGTTSVFQLVKNYVTYASDGTTVVGSEARPIFKPISGTASVWVDGVFDNNHSIDYTTGLVTFSSGHIPASGKAITATFQFDTPVRFDTDQMKVTLEDWNAYSWGSILLKEIIPYGS